MTTIEFYLNIVHFCFFKSLNKLNLLYKKVSPTRLLFKIPAIRNKAKKENVDLNQVVDIVLNNKEFGLSITYAGGFIFATLFFLVFGVFGTLRKLFTEDVLTMPHFIFFGILSAVACYHFVFKKDKYIKYFDDFEKWTKSEKLKYSWLTFGFSVFVFIIWILSF